MKANWLFGFPEKASWAEVSAWADQATAADPGAAVIPELDAEQFMAAGYVINSARPKMFNNLKKVFRVRVPSDNEEGRRRAVILLLRQWKLRTTRDLLLSLVPQIINGRFPDPELNPQFWTDERFHEAYCDNIALCWLTQVKRYLDPTVKIDEWLAALDAFAPTEYAIWVKIGRLTLRRLVYPPAPAVRAEQEAATGLIQEVRAQSEQSGALRQRVRRLEQDRKRLKEDAHRREQERKQVLSEAHGELATARRRLNDRRDEMPRELAAQAKRYEAELARLRQELERAQSEFQAALRGRAAPFLRGRTVAIHGGEPKENRMLVETLGGVLSTEDTAIGINGDGGPADVERQLHGVALANVQIRCDGSRRRKGQRPGIATSAFEAYLDGEAVHREYRVVCCGPAASSQMAEYGAVVMALSWLHAAGPAPGSQVEVWSDCRNLVDHVTGRRPLAPVRGCTVLDRKLRSLMRALAQHGCSVNLRWVRRDLVDACDRLCDLAYREAVWYHRPAANGRRQPLSAFLCSLPRSS
ncbi:MAG TPA: hypothetical protein VGK74_23730 [Symbiobacteriaceae bacterium]|jgi:ribonuclease HI